MLQKLLVSTNGCEFVRTKLDCQCLLVEITKVLKPMRPKIWSWPLMIWPMTSSVSGFESRSESESTVTERRFIDRSLVVGVDTKDGY